MADNYSFNPTGSSTAAADNIGGVIYPRAKVSLGDDGTAADWGPSNPAPVNVTQVGGTTAVAPTFDNGTSGAGVQRVTIASDSTGQITARGNVASGASDSGNPVKVGGISSTSLSDRTLVSTGQRIDAVFGVDGALITRPHCNLEDIVSGVAAITDGSSTSVIGAAGAGVKIYITEVTIANSSASNVTVDLRDGTGGAVKATFSAPANGGCVKTYSVPLPFSANTIVAADPSASATTVTVSLVGFKSKI